MKIIDEKRSSLDSLIYVFFFLGTLGIVFSLKGMYSDQPMLWLSKPLAWGIIIGFALTLAGLILRLRIWSNFHGQSAGLRSPTTSQFHS